ncbi:hypothetical protein JQ628_24275 [Bradyrhizobium lablabi]|nr:hypothetical protein [Bradyrhizobium lablabi]MBR1124662.1 hypothetical protein [Bradyrhizobium lablabi]
MVVLAEPNLPCRPVITLPSDHSPFFSMPDRLAAALIRIAEDFARHWV